MKFDHNGQENNEQLKEESIEIKDFDSKFSSVAVESKNQPNQDNIFSTVSINRRYDQNK
jgi:hypothetical protein